MESGARSLKGFYLPLAVKNFEIRPTSQEFSSLYEKAKTEREAERENEPAQKETKSSETSMDENEPGIHKFGSVTDQLIGEDPLLASQFSLIETDSRVREMTLIEQRVKLIKSHFNKQFDAVFRQKQNEIAKIGEKNERISEISRDTGVEFELLRPQLDDSERTELVFEVEDEEVEVERVLTEEQQALLDEQRRQEEERKANKGDNARDRALLEMMDGVLEVKSEDVLKIDVPRPAFMDDADRHESDWTDEEVKQAREYDKKCVALEEERTKFKKSLEIEAKKTQQGIVEGMHAFDLTIQGLKFLIVFIILFLRTQPKTINRSNGSESRVPSYWSHPARTDLGRRSTRNRQLNKRADQRAPRYSQREKEVLRRVQAILR
jgi:hypothetical protein